MKMSKKEKTLRKSYKGIFKAINTLTNAEAICQLETAKVDILLNDGLVVLDGHSGKLTTKKNKFQKS